MARTTRRNLLRLTAGTAAVLGMHRAAFAVGAPSGSEADAHTGRQAFTPLPLGEVLPTGWLLRQLRIQATGLGGHLDEFWPDVGANSGWLGGTGESWERGPYFVDGLLPLAYLLKDERLKAKAMRFVEWTLTHQAANGMIGPAGNDDWWPRMVMVKVLAQYYDATRDPRVISVLTGYFHHQLAEMPGRPLRDWGKYRWQDEALVVLWLHEKTGDPKLLELAFLLQQQGYDWVKGFQTFRYTGVTTRAYLDSKDAGGNKPEGMQTHGVNNGQALKTAAVRYRLTGSPAEQENYGRQLATLDRYHGQPNGMFSCDEHLAGLDPSHGTELCTVVETMYSLEVSLATFGESLIGDRLETIAYNALPGTFTDDMWAHQYNQQANQVQVGLNSKPWTTDGPESNIFGLEPNFGCCTANFHQGWPKFAAHLWMRSNDDGLVAALYAPCEVRTTVAGVETHVEVVTDYPFTDSVQIRLRPRRSVTFPLRLRIPEWCHNASLQINGKATSVSPHAGSFLLLHREWKPDDVLDLHLPMQATSSQTSQGALVLKRGPLVFSLDPGESWVKLRDRGQTADWQAFPNGAWNYALVVNKKLVPDMEVIPSPSGESPFSASGCGIRLRVMGRRLDAWRSEDGVAGAVPAGVQSTTNAAETLTLIPYGAAKLRITAFPYVSGPAKET